MPQIIASTYELLEKIGSGGAGIVYLGRHIRLNKQVVLKADKRTLATKPETLRREVDALKNLSHTYIPQVYDFVEEDGVVYTVMDFIEGESLDKPLSRKERFPQVQVIEWGCELLEALCYLHSRPPHGILHSDIKPSNIMCTPQGDIRLIDFNIALALGEEGSVRVGFSRGYASPEHYGIDYFSHSKDSDVTELMESTTHPHQTGSSPYGSSSTATQKRTILLDVRSDIYSAGATLYHLLTGVRPAADARQVPVIRHPAVSPAVAEIIHKAMEPDPDQRYQTAQEMLQAFEHLHENDPRMQRHRRRIRFSAAALSVLFLIGGACTFTGLKQMERAQALAAEEARIAEETERTAKRALADTVASEATYLNGNIDEAVQLARDALSLQTVYDARAQTALTNALGVYDLSGGYRAHALLELPSEPTQAVLSPEGTRIGAMAGGQMLVFDTNSGEQLAALPAENSALAQLVFQGEDVVIYAGDGALRAYDLAQKRELWSGEAATVVALSADGTTVAAAYRDDPAAVIYDAASGAVLQTVDFRGNHLNAAFNDTLVGTGKDLFALNRDGTLLAAGFADGGALFVFNLRDKSQDIQIYDKSEFVVFDGGFNGQYLAFTGWDKEKSVFVIFDTAQLVQCYGFSDRIRFRVQADENGIFLSVGRLLAQIDPVTAIDTELAYNDVYLRDFAVEQDGKCVLRDEDGQMYAFGNNRKVLTAFGEQGAGALGLHGIAGQFIFSANEQAIRLWKLDEKPESLLMSFEGEYDYNEARVSGDGKTVMLFRYDRFWLLDMDGNLLQRVEIPIPDGDQVYDQQFLRDENGSRLEVTYYSGLVRYYSAADGSLLSEEQVTPPDESLAVTYYTDAWRIEQSLHSTPLVYDRTSGNLLGELETEDYLTYVTQTGGGVITEYISTETGKRYGLLLNENLETLGRMPGLCDIMEDGRLIFDDGAGHLRQTKLYTTEELLALAGNY